MPSAANHPHSRKRVPPARCRSLGWLLLSAVGGALAALVVAGVLAGRLGLPISGGGLLGAGLLGALPQLVALVRGRWRICWPELAAMVVGCAAVSAVGLALAWPALLPLGGSVDAVHHTQLIAWVAEHHALPTPNGDEQGLLGEMTAYPVGLVLLVIASATLSGQSLLQATYPTVALLGGLIAGLVVLLAAQGSGVRGQETERPGGSTQHSMLRFLALLIGPLLLLAHRTYFFDAYTEQNYYTMLLGVLLLLLAAAWLLIEPPLHAGAAAQFGLVLAALVCNYPLWVPLPAALALVVLARNIDWQAVVGRRFPQSVLSVDHRPPTTDHRPPTIVRRPSSVVPRLGLLAFGPAILLALLDLLPRLRVGQAVLAHQGLISMPTAARLVPLLLALPCAALLLRSRVGRGLIAMAGLVLAAVLGLALAARAGYAASYHSYKLLFVLLPLASAIVSAAAARLLGGEQSEQPAMHAAVSQANRAHQSRWRALFSAHVPLGSDGGQLLFQPSGLRALPDTLPAPARNLLSQPARQRLAALALVVLLTATGSFQIVPPPAIRLIDPDLVAAADWLRASSPRDAIRAVAIGAPAGSIAYWVEVGLLGQRRDQAFSAVRGIDAVPPTAESWLINQQLAPVAIASNFDQPLPGMQLLARFGQVAVVRRAKQIDTAALHPLAIRYQSSWDEQRIKTTIELDQPSAGPLPLLEVLLYHNGAVINRFALAPDPARTRTQYLGVDLLNTLGGSGYINQSDYPSYAGLAAPPTGALTLTLQLSVAGNPVDQRPLATFARAADGQISDLATSSGELVYLRNPAEAGAIQAAAISFGPALVLTGQHVPAQAAPGALATIQLRWQTNQPIERAFFPEVQLLNQDGQPVASNLAAPQHGFYPTWRWRVGERVDEQRALELPPNLAPGVYRVALRVRDFAADRALPAAGADANGWVLLGEIAVMHTA